MYNVKLTMAKYTQVLWVSHGLVLQSGSSRLIREPERHNTKKLRQQYGGVNWPEQRQRLARGQNRKEVKIHVVVSKDALESRYAMP